MRALLTVLLFSTLVHAQPAPWTFDRDHSELVVKVWKTGAAASLAHDHVVRATRFEGAASLDDSGKPESLSLELKVDVDSLVADEPVVRERYHLPNTPLSPADMRTVKENMLSEGQLDAARFPSIGFTLKKVYREDSGALTGLGTLTLHGVSKEISFPITLKSGDRQMEGSASVRLKTSTFGIKPYSAALGLIRNKDDVELVVHLVLKR